MGGGKNSGSSEAAQARADEEARQKRIREGTARINSIFNGSTIGKGALTAGTAYDPTKTYYLKDGSVWKPTAAATSGFSRAAPLPSGGGPAPSSMFGSSAFPNSNANSSSGNGSIFGNNPVQLNADGTPKASTAMFQNTIPGAAGATASAKSAADQFAEMVANGGLYQGVENTGGFGDDFFANRKQAYLDYATPQLQDQYSDAQKQLTFALARTGNLNSSARSEKSGDLQKLYDLNNQQIADQALSYETQARNSVEDARANLIATLNATGDAEGAANSALARATALSQPAAYSPLSQLFADFTNGLGVQAAQEKTAAASGGSYAIPVNTGLFSNTGRVKVSG